MIRSALIALAVAGAIAMAVELGHAQSAPGTAMTARARDATDALEIAGPWVAFLLSLGGVYFVDRDRRRVIGVLEGQSVAHTTELNERRAEHLSDLRRFTGETLALSSTVVQERERGLAQFERWERLFEDALTEMRRARS